MRVTNRRLRGASIVLAGLALFLVCVVLQISTYFTPVLARHPLVLVTMPLLGGLVMAVTSLTMAILALVHQSRKLAVLALGYAVITLFIRLIPLATAFQLSLMGLLVGALFCSMGWKMCQVTRPSK